MLVKTLTFSIYLCVTLFPVTAASTCGLASWYGRESGHRTASGGYFDGSQWLVAHRTLPLGTRVRITYNGHSVVAPVLDRGPYAGGRMLDLSSAVADALGTKHGGVVRVCIDVLG